MNTSLGQEKTKEEERAELERLRNDIIVVSLSQESLVNLHLKFGKSSSTNGSRGGTSAVSDSDSLLDTAGKISTVLQILSGYEKDVFVVDTGVAWELYTRGVLSEIAEGRDFKPKDAKPATDGDTSAKDERSLKKLHTVLGSNCPGFAVYSEKIAPADVVSHLSSTANHLQIQGSLVKSLVPKGLEKWRQRVLNNNGSCLSSTNFANIGESDLSTKKLLLSHMLFGNARGVGKKISLNNTGTGGTGTGIGANSDDTGGRNVFHVVVAPCYDRKIEFARPEYAGVDLILATEELQELISMLPKLEETSPESSADADEGKRVKSKKVVVPGISPRRYRNPNRQSPPSESQASDSSDDLKVLKNRLYELSETQFLIDTEGRMTKPSKQEERRTRNVFSRVEVGPVFSIGGDNGLREIRGFARQVPVSETVARLVMHTQTQGQSTGATDSKLVRNAERILAGSITNSVSQLSLSNPVLTKQLPPINSSVLQDDDQYDDSYDLLTSVYQPVRRDVYFAHFQKLAAIAYGFKHIQNVSRIVQQSCDMQDRAASGPALSQGTRKDYEFVEVLACPGGCLNGGGQIKLENPEPEAENSPVGLAGRLGTIEEDTAADSWTSDEEEDEELETKNAKQRGNDDSAVGPGSKSSEDKVTGEGEDDLDNEGEDTYRGPTPLERMSLLVHSLEPDLRRLRRLNSAGSGVQLENVLNRDSDDSDDDITSTSRASPVSAGPPGGFGATVSSFLSKLKFFSHEPNANRDPAAGSATKSSSTTSREKPERAWLGILRDLRALEASGALEDLNFSVQHHSYAESAQTINW